MKSFEVPIGTDCILSLPETVLLSVVWSGKIDFVFVRKEIIEKYDDNFQFLT